MPDLASMAAIKDPVERAEALTTAIDEHQEVGREMARMRRVALEELTREQGWTQAQIAERLGKSRSRISMMLSTGVLPERAFFGVKHVMFAIGSKLETGRSDPSNMLSAQTFAAFQTLAEAAKATGLESEHEIVPPPGLVDLNRDNLVVLTSPRLLPIVGQVQGADPHLRFSHDQDGWFLMDHATGTEYRSPHDRGEPTDYAYVGRLPRPDGKGTFLYIAGIHARGTLGAAQYVATHLKDLYKELKTTRFSVLLACSSAPGTDPADTSKEALTVERVTPVYRQDAA